MWFTCLCLCTMGERLPVSNLKLDIKAYDLQLFEQNRFTFAFNFHHCLGPVKTCSLFRLVAKTYLCVAKQNKIKNKQTNKQTKITTNIKEDPNQLLARRIHFLSITRVIQKIIIQANSHKYMTSALDSRIKLNIKLHPRTMGEQLFSLSFIHSFQRRFQ